VPEIELSSLAVVHMDTTPSPISTPGTPNVVASPVRSLWQTNTVAAKISFNASWALRDSRALAWMTVRW
jgi:hypothetical protein